MGLRLRPLLVKLITLLDKVDSDILLSLIIDCLVIYVQLTSNVHYNHAAEVIICNFLLSFLDVCFLTQNQFNSLCLDIRVVWSE